MEKCGEHIVDKKFKSFTKPCDPITENITDHLSESKSCAYTDQSNEEKFFSGNTVLSACAP